MERYTVFENTPGYLPEELDLVGFATLAEARAYARQLADEYRDLCPDERVEISGGPDTIYVDFPDRPHDLGRVVTVVDTYAYDTYDEV